MSRITVELDIADAQVAIRTLERTAEGLRIDSYGGNRSASSRDESTSAQRTASQLSAVVGQMRRALDNAGVAV
jgi:hypothetical protein